MPSISRRIENGSGIITPALGIWEVDFRQPTALGLRNRLYGQTGFTDEVCAIVV